MNKTGFALIVALCMLGGCKRSDNAGPPAAASAPPAPAASGPAPEVLPAPVPEPEPAAGAASAPPKTVPAPVRTRQAARTGKPPMLRAVRSARQPGADRVTFEFDGAVLPEWHAEFVERPHDCGSGDPVPVAGAAWLQIRFTGAQAHTDQGAATSGARRRTLDGRNARELVRTCDFEGEVTWVIGVSRNAGFKTMELAGPSRLAIDVAN